uniref:Adenine DNA glycosylase n=1 Tax=Candidatus Kentrum sp. SD TaxID=2126332 RepID=A0A450YT71_9GAMM|nr:MAG: A/G-specific DNA-adenine glycosylase [Candidatus Kentron sp. SD]VFK44758.1 MAG: A/G-specific DNA-adenine glycosylase [Candidatus Kentron sp. SD]
MIQGLRMTFSDLVLAWRERAGRRDLPWQREVTGYRVWVSEIMLQQTRVGAVLAYFERFMARFPTVADLALADPDEVLHLWSGLGYYARARNLHKAARVIHTRHGDGFPTGFDEVRALPGIGRSTAGAILALAFGQRHAILDGNVKRVLARYHAIAGWPGDTAVAKELWALAERHTPRHRVAEYTQAMMDLGALVCARARPSCPDCPLRGDCRAHAKGQQQDFPAKRPRKAIPARVTRFILVVRGKDPHDAKPCRPTRSVLLERRPPTGVWGGLWSFPECSSAENLDAWSLEKFGAPPLEKKSLSPFRHTFTHFHLDIHPTLLWYEVAANGAFHGETTSHLVDEEENDHHADGNQTLWYPLDGPSAHAPPALGLAAPVTRLLDACRGAMRQGHLFANAAPESALQRVFHLANISSSREG